MPAERHRPRTAEEDVVAELDGDEDLDGPQPVNDIAEQHWDEHGTWRPLSHRGQSW